MEQIVDDAWQVVDAGDQELQTLRYDTIRKKRLTWTKKAE